MIRFADVKAAAVLAAAGVLAGQLPSAHGSWVKVVLLVAGVCIAFSALLALYTLTPQRPVVAALLRLRRPAVRRRPGSIRRRLVESRGG